MLTAKDVRDDAWKRLGEGAWPAMIAGFAVLFVLNMVLHELLRRWGLANGWIREVELADLIPPEWLSPETVLPKRRLEVPASSSWVAATAVLGWIWDGVLLFGAATISLAAVRGGARVWQVLSGFSGLKILFRAGFLNFLTALFTGLWSLLLIVPGFYAFYSYRMARFLLADHPEWTAMKAIGESKRMMYGNRWRLACLDFSFLGWMILVALTGGLAALFVTPYMNAAFASFYEDLLDRGGEMEGGPSDMGPLL